MMNQKIQFSEFTLDGLKNIIESYPNFFNTSIKYGVKNLGTSEKGIDYKILSHDFVFFFLFFLMALVS